MIINYSDIKKWMGVHFANKIKKDYQKNKIKTIADFLQYYHISQKFGRNGFRKIIKKEVKERWY